MTEPAPSATARPADARPSPEWVRLDGELRLTYRLGIRDLYWLWETSTMSGLVALIFLPVAATLLPAAFVGSSHDPLNFLFGLIALAVAFGFGLYAGILLDRSVQILRRREVGIVITDDGVAGWPVPPDRWISWRLFGRPRIERGAMILPPNWAASFGYVIVPPRALTPAQFEQVLHIAGRNGWFMESDGRTRWGQMLDAILRLVPFSRLTDKNGRLKYFPIVGGTGWTPRILARLCAFALGVVLLEVGFVLQDSARDAGTRLANGGALLLCLAVWDFFYTLRGIPAFVRAVILIVLFFFLGVETVAVLVGAPR